MVRIIAALLGGLLTGIAISYFAFVRDDGSVADEFVVELVRDIADVPQISTAAAIEHRDKQYAELTTIAEIQALPGSFVRAEALYLLAGRSDSAAVQNLIFDANRIADDMNRYAALRILFQRLAEMDPHSALALSRTEYFKGVRMFEQTVWQTWARKDFEGALFAAKTQASRSDQNMAAQALFAAFGFMGNETTDRIEEELGIAPDRGTRSRFLYLLVDRSPAEAIAYINSMPRGAERQEFVWWLAYYLSLRDAEGAATYAGLFEVFSEAERYRETLKGAVARENPEATIDEILASGRTTNRSGEFFSAMQTLAANDIEKAMQYYDQVSALEQKQSIGSIIINALAEEDPAKALRWARTQTAVGSSYFETVALTKIAETDPQYALSEAQNSSSTEVRQQLVSNIISRLVRTDPPEAAEFLSFIDNPELREQAAADLASNWIQHDPEAGLAWVMRYDEQTAAKLLQRSSWALIQSDVDAAIRVLPLLNENQQQHWRMQIAERLVATRSVVDAQAFISRFESEPGYEQLQSRLISALAQSDPMRAQQMADQLTDSRARDSAYTQIIGVRAQNDPQSAAAMLSSIADEHYRGMATAQVASHWYSVDSAAATRWVSDLPVGATRDDAIMQLASAWSAEPGREQQALVNSIRDDDKRGMAKLRQAYNMMRTDPVRAREMLQDPDIPSYQRQQAEMAMKNYGVRY